MNDGVKVGGQKKREKGEVILLHISGAQCSPDKRTRLLVF